MTERKRPNGGPVPPSGPPIHDAIASGDLQRMKAVAEAARKALYGVEFQPVTDGSVRRGEASTGGLGFSDQQVGARGRGPWVTRDPRHTAKLPTGI
ncbi:DUF1843 domain-containing protein [Streptomyces sp. NPDC058755]|uniref:DUF1843 domain-containing protein n=1 Tax=Streptomyces sp. NPDC058755 TaxID=3346624 RepID=UPI0036C45810